MTFAPALPSAIYIPERERFVPTLAAAGPWDAGAQHGGPTAALIARQIEQVPSAVPQQIARLTFDLLRPVPMAPLEVHTKVVREGHKVSVIDAVLTASGKTVMRASALRVRKADLPLPKLPADDPAPGGPDDCENAGPIRDTDDFNSLGVEIRFLEGGFRQPGPGTAWVRLRLPLIAGEEPSTLVRAAAMADMGSAISSVLRQRDWTFINPDLTLHLSREPVGEWFALRSATQVMCAGAGMAESALYDESGRLGRAVQSLFVAPRH